MEALRGPHRRDLQAQGGDGSVNASLLAGLGRAIGGALIFGLPILMTMEMWQLGFHVDRFRLLLLLVLSVPLLIVVARHAGFEKTSRWREAARDAAVAIGIGTATGTLVLVVLGVLDTAQPANEIAGKITLQSIPASIGALLGRSQLGGEKSDSDGRSEGSSYASQLFLMGVGALFLGLNVAPTEEMVLLSYLMTEWHALALMVLSVLLMHGFVYALEFRGGILLDPSTPWWSAFVRFTLPGYLIALSASFYLLWTFGRTDGTSLLMTVMAMIVLAFPAAIGAAAARLIL